MSQSPVSTDNPSVAATPHRLGFIGLGNMGLPMARRLIAAGHAVTVWNRNGERARSLQDLGAAVASTPAELAEQCEIVGLCLTNGDAVREVVTGPRGLLAATHLPGVAVDFSTIAPEEAREMAAHSAARGMQWVDAPVSGGVPAAEAGTLICFAGGEAAAIDVARVLLAPLTQRVSHMGPNGAGQATKICNQMIVAVNVLAIAETVAFARKAGVSTAALAPALAGGFADSTPLQIFAPRMAAGPFEPRQPAIGLMAKDIGISQARAQDLGAVTPLCGHASELYQGMFKTNPELRDADVSELVRQYDK